MLSFIAAILGQVPLRIPSFSPISASASTGPMNNATTTDAAVIIKLYHSRRRGSINAHE